MNEILADRRVYDLTVGELRRLILEVLEEARPRRFRDSDGFLVFLSEAEYRDYLSLFPDPLSGDIRAYYVTPEGYKVRYSSEALSTEAEERLVQSLRDMESGEVRDLEDIAAELGLDG